MIAKIDHDRLTESIVCYLTSFLLILKVYLITDSSFALLFQIVLVSLALFLFDMSSDFISASTQQLLSSLRNFAVQSINQQSKRLDWTESALQCSMRGSFIFNGELSAHAECIHRSQVLRRSLRVGEGRLTAKEVNHRFRFRFRFRGICT